MTNATAMLNRKGPTMATVDNIDVRVIGPVNGAHLLSIQRYAGELTVALSGLDGVEARRALTPHRGPQPPAPRTHRGRLPIRVLRRARRRVARLHSTAQLRRIHADIVHLVFQRDAALLDSLSGARTVQTVHDLRLAQNPDAREVKQLLTSLPRAGHLVAISETTRRDVLEYLDVLPERVSMIPNGLAGHFRPLPSARLGAIPNLPPHQYRILHVASHAQRQKNLPMTIRVLHALRQQGLDATLVRVGVPLPEAEQALANELGVAPYVVECGYVSEDRLVEWYNAADVLLFPSTHEGFGWPPLEAMACGLPVVVSDAGALPETVGPPADAAGRGGAALVAGPHDLEGLTSHVARVLTDSALGARLREAGLARAGEFSWDRTARAYLEVYRALLDR